MIWGKTIDLLIGMLIHVRVSKFIPTDYLLMMSCLCLLKFYSWSLSSLFPYNSAFSANATFNHCNIRRPPNFFLNKGYRRLSNVSTPIRRKHAILKDPEPPSPHNILRNQGSPVVFYWNRCELNASASAGSASGRSNFPADIRLSSFSVISILISHSPLGSILLCRFQSLINTTVIGLYSSAITARGTTGRIFQVCLYRNVVICPSGFSDTLADIPAHFKSRSNIPICRPFHNILMLCAEQHPGISWEVQEQLSG